jgi:hypothetical protein
VLLVTTQALLIVTAYYQSWHGRIFAAKKVRYMRAGQLDDRTERRGRFSTDMVLEDGPLEPYNIRSYATTTLNRTTLMKPKTKVRVAYCFKPLMRAWLASLSIWRYSSYYVQLPCKDKIQAEGSTERHTRGKKG